MSFSPSFTPGSPAALGYRMPAEWEQHSGTWLSWPYNLSTWEGHLEGAEEAFTQIIAALVPHEAVHLLVPNANIQKRAVKILTKAGVPLGNLTIHQIESGDVWIRDYGPTFLVRDGTARERGYVKWTYNAYGKIEEYADLLIGNDVFNTLKLPGFARFDAGMVLEGGSIDVNGTGSLLTTESCLLSPDRNPHLSREQIEGKLRDLLGVTNILWLSEGIAGDDTTGHIDDLTRFVGKSTVVTVVEDDPQDENYAPLQENMKRLRGMKDEEGILLTVIPLPMPKSFIVEDRRMAATYANFYIANTVVLVPIYAQSSDTLALATLQKCFPSHHIIGINCRELIWGYGSIHCASQQEL